MLHSNQAFKYQNPCGFPIIFILAVWLPLFLGVGLSWANDELNFGLETNRLGEIQITGNKAFSDGDLKSVLRIQEPTWKRPLNIPRYQPHMIDAQIGLLQSFYRNNGFHQVSVRLDSISHDLEIGDIIYIGVKEGHPTVINKIVFEGTGPLAAEELDELLLLRVGRPAPSDLRMFGGDLFSIREKYRAAAYLDAVVDLSMDIHPDPSAEGFLATVNYQLRPGSPYQVRNILLKGNTTAHDNLLQRELTIKPGESLNWFKVEQSRRNLLASSLFRDVGISAVNRDTLLGKADVQVEVIERLPAFYELGVGVGSLERVRLLAAWGHYNLLGTGRRVQVRGRGSWNVEDVVGNSTDFDQGQINYRADIVYVNPRVQDSRFSFDFDVYMKRETRGESGMNMLVHGLGLGSTWKGGRRVTNNFFFGIKITDPQLHPLAPDNVRQSFEDADVKKVQTHSLNYSIYVDKRNDLFQPTSGMYSIGTLKMAGSIMGGDATFFKWSLSWHNYHKTFLGGTLAVRTMFGGAQADGGPSAVPYDDRFFAGGSSTVRGYRHNSLGPQIIDSDEYDNLNYSSDVLLPDNPAQGGSYLMLSNVEWRFPLPVLERWNLSSVVFFEGGNVWEHLSDIRMQGFRLRSYPGDDPNSLSSTKTWDYRYSVGTGVRLNTPFGPFRVDVGFPLKRARYKSLDKDITDPSMLWHFSLGYPF
jgi:outer membrane protein insertion porin family